MDKLKNCIHALQILATQANDPGAQVLAERRINDFLREEDGTISADLERIGRAIDTEIRRNTPGEDWSLMQAYIQWCCERLAPKE